LDIEIGRWVGDLVRGPGGGDRNSRRVMTIEIQDCVEVLVGVITAARELGCYRE
jgi:hypothetical protein